MSDLGKDWFSRNVDDDIAKILVKLKISIGDDKFIERDFRPDVKIEYEELEEQLEDTPSLFAFWSSVLAEQRAQVAIIERSIKMRRGTVTRTLLEESKSVAAKGVGLGTRPGLRKDDIKDLLEADKELAELDAKYIIANKRLSKLYGVVDAIRMKSEHLRSLSGFKRIRPRP